MSRAYEDYVRSCMATGCSARHCRDIQLLTFGFLVDVNEGSKLTGQVPKINWFAQQREAMGLRSNRCQREPNATINTAFH